MPVTSATGSRGFTLLELLVVLTILVLMAAAWPLAARRLFPGQQLRNAAQSFVADVRIARLTSRTTGTPQGITVDDTGTAYITASGTHLLSSGVLMRVRTEPAYDSRRVQFYPDGSTSGAILDFELPSRSVSVAVSPLTGRTEILE
jgi:general secretion pathway protein H